MTTAHLYAEIWSCVLDVYVRPRDWLEDEDALITSVSTWAASDEGSRPVGFRNYGATCFLNSVLQPLLKIQPLRAFFEAHIADTQRDCGDSCVLCASRDVLAGGDPRPFEVVGIPLAQPGFHVVEIESRRLGEALLDKKAPMFVRTAVLATNLGVHVKIGRENALVWVTSLDRGAPVAGAEVAVNDCRGQRLWAGKTDANGIAKVAQALVEEGECPADAGFFVTARASSPSGPAVCDSSEVMVRSPRRSSTPWIEAAVWKFTTRMLHLPPSTPAASRSVARG